MRGTTQSNKNTFYIDRPIGFLIKKIKYCMFSPLRRQSFSLAQNALTNTPSSSLNRMTIQQRRDEAISIVANSTFQAFNNIKNGGSRCFVTASTYKKLNTAAPDLIDVPNKVKPYQRYRDCDLQTQDTLYAWEATLTQRRQADKTAVVPKEENDFPLSFLPGFIKGLLKPPIIKRDDLGFRGLGKKTLDFYQKHGAFGLRLPGLSQFYRQHVVPVLAVIEIEVNNEKKVVGFVLDCSDRNDDPATEASITMAKESGLVDKKGIPHLNMLTHEQADSNGAHLYRIRLIDMDKAGELSHDVFRKFNFQAEGYFGTDDIRVDPPEVIYFIQGLKRPSPKEESRLAEIFTEIYDSEVEKFDNFSFEKLIGTYQEDVNSDLGEPKVEKKVE